MTTVFDTIVDANQLESWVQETLQSWWKTYAREYERSRGLDPDVLPEPRTWMVAEELQKEGTDQLPAVVIVSPGLNGDQPRQEGDGSLRAVWTVGVGVFVSAATRADTKKLVRHYAAIIRMIMLQKQSFGGHCSGSEWLDESYDDTFSFTDDLTISAGQVIFDVEVPDVANRFAGPVGLPDPDTQPGSEWHTADTVEVDVVKEEI